VSSRGTLDRRMRSREIGACARTGMRRRAQAAAGRIEHPDHRAVANGAADRRVSRNVPVGDLRDGGGRRIRQPMRRVQHNQSGRTHDDSYKQAKPDKPTRVRAPRRRLHDRVAFSRVVVGRRSVGTLAGQRSTRPLRAMRRPGLLGSGRSVITEVLILPTHAVDLVRNTAPRRHEPGRARLRWITCATGSKDWEISRSRPHTCGWEAPRDRLGNRSPASQGTRLCVGRGMVIGVSLPFNPTGAGKRDREICPTGRWPSLLGWRAAAQAGHGLAGRPCGTSPPTNRGCGRTRCTPCRPRAGLRAQVAGRTRARARSG
jgi:hypothetical protein